MQVDAHNKLSLSDPILSELQGIITTATISDDLSESSAPGRILCSVAKLLSMELAAKSYHVQLHDCAAGRNDCNADKHRSVNE